MKMVKCNFYSLINRNWTLKGGYSLNWDGGNGRSRNINWGVSWSWSWNYRVYRSRNKL